MRRTFLISFAVLLVTLAAYGEDRATTRVAVYASNISVLSGSSNGTEVWGGVGIGLTYFLAPRFAMELSYGMDKTYRNEYSIEGDFFRRQMVRAYPL